MSVHYNVQLVSMWMACSEIILSIFWWHRSWIQLIKLDVGVTETADRAF